MVRTPLDTIRARVKDGSMRVLGEAIWQFEGLAPDDKRLEPFWSLAEEMDPIPATRSQAVRGLTTRGVE